MAKIEGIRISNYRALRSIHLGMPGYAPLTPMTAVIGRNGVGKSSLFDAFGFLADCLKFGVEEACDAGGRGGFGRLRFQGSHGPIMFRIFYREKPQDRPVSYFLDVDEDELGRPYVKGEFLGEARGTEIEYLPSSCFLFLIDGKGMAWTGETEAQRIDEAAGFSLENLNVQIKRNFDWAGGVEAERVELQDKRKLGIATLGALKQHPRIAAFRRFVEGWYLSYFTPDAARALPLAGPQRRLNTHGDNLGNVVQFMEREHPERFASILRRVAERIPGIDRIDTVRSPDGRLLLRFNDKGFEDPFYAQQMSDGTLKLFAYLIMLEDPTPPPLICIEEPENGLYHKLLEILAGEFRARATGKEGAPQVFVTTHQPYFVDALRPEETWILEKGDDGFSKIRCASEDPTVAAMVKQELPLGGLWYSDYLD